MSERTPVRGKPVSTGRYKIERTDIYRAVLERIQAFIVDQDIQPGQRLPSERELAELLAVSRVTVRQALKVLEDIGKIEIVHGSGTYLKAVTHERLMRDLCGNRTLDLDLIRELIPVRAALDCKALEAMAAVYKPSFMKKLRAIVGKRAVAGAPMESWSLDLRLEAAFAELSGNELLAKLQGAVHELWAYAWTGLGLAPANPGDFHDEHLDILKAIESEDWPLAQALLAEHVGRSLEEMAPKSTSASLAIAA
jgi:GntR family transcriptional regulator, transcriptional repressor for pyruvate dehydrogenase complex